MVRVLAIVEGQTEELFFAEIIRPWLAQFGVYIDSRLTGFRKRQGGDVRYDRVKKDIRKIFETDPNIYITTFYDYYGLGSGFPGKDQISVNHSHDEKKSLLESAMIEDIKSSLRSTYNPNRIIPYFQMYEFEALLFSDPGSIVRVVDQLDAKTLLESIRDQVNTPEEINENKSTSPSHRLRANLSDYDKVLVGNLIALEIGIEKIREECPLFREWLDKLAALGKS